MTPRIALAVAGLAALALPLPGSDVPGVGLTAFGLVCLAAALARPGSAAPALVIGAAALSWLAAPDQHGSWLRLGALALAVTAVHSAAALAAVVPAGSRVPAALSLRWAGWTAAAAAVGAGTVAVVGQVPGRAAPVLPTAVVLAVLAGGLAVAAVARTRR